MKFRGSNGNLMGNTDLREMLELIYAPKAFMRIHTGKAVATVFGGHMIIDTALYCLLISANIYIIYQYQYKRMYTFKRTPFNT